MQYNIVFKFKKQFWNSYMHHASSLAFFLINSKMNLKYVPNIFKYLFEVSWCEIITKNISFTIYSDTQVPLSSKINDSKCINAENVCLCKVVYFNLRQRIRFTDFLKRWHSYYDSTQRNRKSYWDCEELSKDLKPIHQFFLFTMHGWNLKR